MSDGLDLSGAFEKLQDMLSTPDGQEQIQGMLSAFTGGSENENSNEQSFECGGGSVNSQALIKPKTQGTSGAEFSDMITPDMIFKIQRIMTLLNKNKSDTSVEFLRCLKPLLKESRRARIDKAVKIITLIKVMEILKKEGGI